MRLALIGLVFVGTIARADAPIVFDARDPYRPKVAALIAGRPAWLLVDTGNLAQTFVGPEAAKQLRLPGGLSSQLGFDVDHRPIMGHSVAARVDVAGMGLVDTVVGVSSWAGALQNGAPRIDGIMAPSQLVREDEALVLDFAAGEMTRVSWAVAEARLAELPRPLVDTPLVHGRAFVNAFIDGHLRSLIVDSGAPITTMYAPRSRDLPRVATRSTVRNLNADVAGFTLTRINVREPIARDDDSDGLLGMDVLRRCAVALDAHRMLVRCRGATRRGEAQPTPLALPAPRSIHYTRPDRTIEVGFGGPRMRPYKSGWLWCMRECVHIRSDGSVERPERRGRGEDPATREFLEATEALRAELHRVDEAERLEASLNRLPKHLANVWAEKRWTLEERRQFLFELWDECIEPTDREGGAGGTTARRIIERFVRERIAAEDAFTSDELRRFNARRQADAEKFDPYQRGVTIGLR